ncbi:glycosyltransferase family 4 protein [Daejeonella sp. JGW-45]|uniref:glycosyltransferase family 4 protein n=1 Tax=Daejeonella sp. JGW-45 TaxID=3034148 RepID=UPI0023ED7911|nr:glycosyltransferase family 4 protein [Daejeonella sp. JGW-45]
MTQNILFFFSSTTVGGAETNIIKISRELSHRGHSIYWCFLVDNGPMLQLADFNLKVLETGLYYKDFFRFRKKYVDFIKANQIECVLNFGLRVEIISRLLSKAAGARKIISNIRSTDDWRKFHHTLLDRMTSFSVDHWVSNSNAGKLIFHRRERIPLHRIEVIYNFIDLQRKGISIVPSANKKIHIGVLANITAEKGYLDLIPLSKLLIQNGIDHVFVCGGKDMLNKRFHQALVDNNIEHHFDLRGYISDKSSFFSSLNLFLLPSYLEGMPTVILEAMSMGIPVISTKVGGIPELIEDGVNGYLFQPGDIQAALDSIILMLQRGQNKKISENAFKRLDQFSKSFIIDKWEKVIQR